MWFTFEYRCYFPFSLYEFLNFVVVVLTRTKVFVACSLMKHSLAFRRLKLWWTIILIPIFCFFPAFQVRPWTNFWIQEIEGSACNPSASTKSLFIWFFWKKIELQLLVITWSWIVLIYVIQGISRIMSEPLRTRVKTFLSLL
jgi:hypothetical protein